MTTPKPPTDAELAAEANDRHHADTNPKCSFCGSDYRKKPIQCLAYELAKRLEEATDDAIMLCYRTVKMGCHCGTCDPCELAKMVLYLRKRGE